MKIYVNILGSEWLISIVEDKDWKSDEFDGLTDPTSKHIYIRGKRPECDLENFEEYQKQVIRHELIHAFLHESGLGYGWQHQTLWGHDETTVDWFAIQIPKIDEAYNIVINKMEETHD